jgi:hypothetical protein
MEADGSWPYTAPGGGGRWFLLGHEAAAKAKASNASAAAVEADLGRLEAAARGALDRQIARHRPLQHARARACSAPLEPDEISQLQGHVQVPGELAAIIGEVSPDLNGIASGGIMLRRRNSIPSRPSSAAPRGQSERWLAQFPLCAVVSALPSAEKVGWGSITCHRNPAEVHGRVPQIVSPSRGRSVRNIIPGS